MARTKCGFNDAPGGASGAEMLVSYGPTLRVDIGFDRTYQPTAGKPPTPGLTGLSALVDTGATESCIDSVLAAHLNLPIIDRRKVSGVHGSDEVNVHLAQVHIPSLDWTIYG